MAFSSPNRDRFFCGHKCRWAYKRSGGTIPEIERTRTREPNWGNMLEGLNILVDAVNCPVEVYIVKDIIAEKYKETLRD